LAGGDWTTDLFGGTSTLVFGHDGSLKMDVSLPIGVLGSEGTFSETEDTVSLTLHRIELPDNPLGSGAKRITDQIVNRPVSFKVTWVSGNEVKLVPDIPQGPFGQEMTLKRRH
jgi:hypothetical protein